MAQLTNSLNYLFSVSLLLFVLLHCLCFRFSLVAACSNSNSTDDQQIQHHHHRKWIGPSGHKVITVSLNGHAQFRSVQDAVDSIPKNNNMSIVIKIAPGFYREKVVVPATKPYITFKGAGRDVTAIEWHDRASDRGPDGQQLRTYQTASVTVYANYFSARNIS
ncbi:putative pectinesterase 68 [Cardamine amara subsp. amara]|uniref:pectinesterase n=1 Tax=Cardamine amara subsp. amara TaxID=228776 RepID=A0ABD1B6B2_CARAN